MDTLETLVRGTLADRAHDAPSDAGLLDAVTGRRRRPWPVVLAASAAAAIAIAVVLIVAHRKPAATSVAGDPIAYERIATHGISLLVPVGVPVGMSFCPLPHSYVLIDDRSVTRRPCSAATTKQRAGVVVHVVTSRYESDVNSPASYLRYSAGRGVRRLADPGVSVVVTAPTDREVHAILTSVRPAPGRSGCPAGRASPGNTSGRTLVRPDPASATRCIYGFRDRLIASVPIDDPAGLAHALNRLQTFAHTDLVNVFEVDRLVFRYSDGATRSITVSLESQTRYSDGNRVAIDLDNAVTRRYLRIGN